MQAGIDALWRFTGEMFESDALVTRLAAAGLAPDPSSFSGEWKDRITGVLSEATLQTPDDLFQRSGGRRGFHTEHLGHMLGEMQWMQRTYPGLEW